MIQIDMEMPKTCPECPFREHFYQDCVLIPHVPAWVEEVTNSRDKRSEHCPLKEVPTMEEKDFQMLVKNCVVVYTNEHLDKSDGKTITNDDVYIVWMCKTLQNNKALASTTLLDGMYYEVTYNGDKNEVYLDAYKKFENKAFMVKEGLK